MNDEMKKIWKEETVAYSQYYQVRGDWENPSETWVRTSTTRLIF